MRDCGKAIGFLRTKLDADHRIRCLFNVAGTNTGRATSSFSDMGTGTNLQNVTGKLKNIFVPNNWILADINLEQGDSRGVRAIAWNWFGWNRGEEWAGRYLDACKGGEFHTTVTQMAWATLGWPEDLDPKLVQVYREPTRLSRQKLPRLIQGPRSRLELSSTSNTMALHTHLPVSTITDFQELLQRLPVCSRVGNKKPFVR